MRHFLGREDLLDMLQTCPLLVVDRLMEEGEVECLGHFNEVCGHHPGPSWLFRVTGRKKEWIIMIHPHNAGAAYSHLIDGIPWEHWAGSRTGLSGGDHPRQYAMNRAKARRRINSEAGRV
ncbi:hypothetical protein LCGC14_0343130 [marine sediment metagenome]|uniref:Uncharacterized protein n=1 Tax=marine sediment metagenome TaxID=412755 RepID=A0A0F9TCW3_9ZZZZ